MLRQDRAEGALEAFIEAVRSSPHNLVSRCALGELETRHLPESVALARLLPPGPAELVDIGTGGGFPGFVIACLREDFNVTLVEATGKKARFLEETATRLRVRARVVNGRIEELGRGVLSQSFDLATARAVAPLRTLVPWAMPVLRPGGQLFAVKGERWEEEVAEARPALRRAAAEIVIVPPVGDEANNVDPPLRLVIIARAAAGARPVPPRRHR
ncbi:MAG: 16S rRNA (guanine(527)-N(7))-methyltransferase RsmG [Actinomycetota bacterium]|nr:16S rRNA (guanine(527)-N(7))-methyltransferase RsmG [Actinomycetota bacterium]